jgi:Na+/melibiose symporter-like transporter
MDHDLPDDATMRSLVAEIGTRATVAVGLAGIALIHLLDSIGKWSETRYLFWMYVGLMIASLATAGWVLFTRSRTALLAAAAVAASALVGYVVSRTVGMPGATHDIGNWTEPLGLASLFVEGAVVAAGLAGLGAARGTVTLTLARPARRRDLAAA